LRCPGTSVGVTGGMAEPGQVPAGAEAVMRLPPAAAGQLPYYPGMPMMHMRPGMPAMPPPNFRGVVMPFVSLTLVFIFSVTICILEEYSHC